MGHILVVEDDEDSARVLSALISRENHSVASAPSLHAARRLLALQSPDLLLLDLHLPDGNGFELLGDDSGLQTLQELSESDAAQSRLIAATAMVSRPGPAWHTATAPGRSCPLPA